MFNLSCIFCITAFAIFNTSLRAESNPWEKHYSDSEYTTPNQIETFLAHHSNQNVLISRDFFKQIFNSTEINRRKTLQILMDASTVLELGCGSGELSQDIASLFKLSSILGVDIASSAIDYANSKNSHANVSYKVFDCMDNIQSNLGFFDLCICSNTLEHFKNPFIILDKMLESSKFVILLVPYNQLKLDENPDGEGINHVFRFTEDTFSSYDVLASFKFQSAGWQHSSAGEQPLQLVVLLRGGEGALTTQSQ